MNITPSQFLEYTPREISAIIHLKTADDISRYKNEWERSRLSTFLIFNSQRSRKNYISWAKFRKDVFPLASDRESGKEVTPEQIENTWTAEDWNKFFKKSSPGEKEKEG